MNLTRLAATLDCPNCGTTHGITIETLEDVAREGFSLNGLTKCGDLIRLYFIVEGGEVVRCVPVEGKITLTEQEKVVIFSTYVKQLVCGRVHVHPGKVELKLREVDIIFARNMIISFIHMKFPKLSLSGISAQIGYKPNHSTVIHSLNWIKRMMVDPCSRDMTKMYNELREEIFGKDSPPPAGL